MLILTRRVGETINIGDEVTVTVLAIRGNQVRIGVSAPKEIPVHREEIYKRVKKEEATGVKWEKPKPETVIVSGKQDPRIRAENKGNHK